jgi:hypothetical protein
MTEPKFTPGPWSVRKQGHPIITDDTTHRYIATIHSVGPENEVREANAHLIAAAPELYRLLDEALSYTSCESWSPSLTHEIKAALAKLEESHD